MSVDKPCAPPSEVGDGAIGLIPTTRKNDEDSRLGTIGPTGKNENTLRSSHKTDFKKTRKCQTWKNVTI